MAVYRFGKHPPKVDYRTLRLSDYLTSELPAPPASYDVLDRVYSNLEQSNPAVLFPMDGNDMIGDCTIAAAAHAITVYRGLTKHKTIPSQKLVEKVYYHLTGGVDSGLNMLDVLNYWRQHSVDKEKILAFVAVSTHNHTRIKQAIDIFGGVYLGFQVQANCIQEFDAHEPWTPGPLTNEGHAVYAVGYDAAGLTVLTWGSTQKATWAWWDECVDEAYAILPHEATDKSFKPGFNFAQLKADLEAVAS